MRLSIFSIKTTCHAFEAGNPVRILNKGFILFKSCFLFLLFMSPCLALHLGDIKVDSYLNEPLKAKIDIDGEKENEPFSAFLADRKTYETLLKEAPSWLEKVKVGIADEKAKSFITLSTTEPIYDLFAELIVNAKIKDEILTKQYTLLLSPRDLIKQEAKTNVPKQKERANFNQEIEQKILQRIGELEKQIVTLNEVNQDIAKKYEFIKNQNEKLLIQINQTSHLPIKVAETPAVTINKQPQLTPRPFYAFLQNNLISLAYYFVKAQISE